MGRYKNEFLARRIKELLQENFTKTKANDKYSELKKAFLNDEDFIDEISNAIQDDFDFDINELKRMFTTNEICSIIDADDAVNYIGDTELLDEMDNDTIADYLMNQNYDTIYKDIDEWSPYDHIQEAAHQLSPNTTKTADDVKKLVCDEIDFQNTGNILI